MNDSRIGWLVAVFYERWSAAYLLARDPRNAQRVLDLGISRKARPLRRLTEALYAARYSGHPPETTSNGSQTHLTALLLQKNGFVEEISPEELRSMQPQYRYHPNDRIPKHSSKHTPGTRTDHTSTHNSREPSASSGYYHSTPLVDEYVNGYARGIGGISPLPDATPSYVNTHIGFSPTPNSETRPLRYPDTHTHTYIYTHTHHPDMRTNRRGEPHLQHTDVNAHRYTPAHTHTHTHTQPRGSRSEPVSVQGEGHNTVHGDEDTQTNNNKNDKTYDTTHAYKHTHTQATNNSKTGDTAHVDMHAHTETNRQTYGTTHADKYTHTPHVGVREVRACVSVRRDISDDLTHSTTHVLRTAGDGTDVKGNKGKVSPGQIETGAQASRRSYMVVDGKRGVYRDSPAKGSARGDGGERGRYSDIQAQGSEYGDGDGDGDMNRDRDRDRDRDRGEYIDVETRTDELGRERRPFGVEAAVSEVKVEDRRGSDRTSAAADARHRDRRRQADGMQLSDNMRHRENMRQKENLRQSADTSRSVVAGVRRLSLVARDSREESGDELTGCGNSAGAERITGLTEPLEGEGGIRIPQYSGTGIGRADRLRDGAPVNARTPAYMSHARHDISGPIPYVSDVREPGHTPSATGSRRSSMMNSGQIRRSDSRSGEIRTGDRPFLGDAIGQGKTPGCTGSLRSSLVSSGQLIRNGTTLKPEPELLRNGREDSREGTGSTELANGLSTHDPFEEKNVRACLECVHMPNHCVFRCLDESAPPISDNRKSLRKYVVLADGMAYVVVKCIGVGAWAKVYLAEHTDPSQHHSTHLYAMKVTRRAIGQWEFYIAHELHRRLQLLPPHLSTTTYDRIFGQAHNLHVYEDAAIVMVDYLDGGSLLDAVNAYDSAGVSMPLELVMFYAAEVLRIVEILHVCDILHGDLKPDNFLLRNGPRIPDSDWSPDKNPDWDEFGLQLIDFGRSVDCSLYPAQTQFSGSNKTEGFICMEMVAHRPWRYQVDTFGVLGIIHCLFHKRYMSVEKRGSRWKPKEAFKRYWQADLWAELFDTFLNINPADEAPSLAPYRIRIERELRDPKRVCKLNAQLKEQISLVQRYRASTGGKVRR